MWYYLVLFVRYCFVCCINICLSSPKLCVICSRTILHVTKSFMSNRLYPFDWWTNTIQKYRKSVTVDLNSGIEYLFGEMQLYKILSQFIPHHIPIICSSDVNFNILIRIRASHWFLPHGFPSQISVRMPCFIIRCSCSKAITVHTASCLVFDCNILWISSVPSYKCRDNRTCSIFRLHLFIWLASLLRGWTVRGSNSGGGEIFCAMPTPPPVQWAPGLSSG
jgi:hypothetical protein